jgi:hypothetical protein
MKYLEWILNYRDYDFTHAIHSAVSVKRGATMKRMLYAFLILLFLLNNILLAQINIKFGFRAGYSLATQYGIHEPDIPYTVDVQYRHGLTGGLLFYFPITESFGVQQEFLYVQKGSREDIDLKGRPIKTRTEYDMSYFEIPVVMRHAFANVKNCKIYWCSGFALSILLNGEYRLSGIAEFEGVPLSFSDTNKIKDVDIFDYGFLYGAGVDCNLFGKHCFFEYRFTIGWNTLMMPTVEGEEPAPLRNQNYIFTVGLYL